MESSEPLVSVVVPVCNGERHVGDAIESILQQHHRHLEVIVVNDGSTDRTDEVVRSFGARVRLVGTDRQGAAAACNLGVEHSSGSLIAFLDHDDLWEPEKLTLQVAALERDPDVAMVFGMMRHFISPETSEEQRRRYGPVPPPLEGLSRCTMLIWRDAFDRVGGFRGGVDAGGFPEWFPRALHLGLRFAVVPETVAARRLHDSNATLLDPARYQRDYLAIARAAIRRRRNGGSSINT